MELSESYTNTEAAVDLSGGYTAATLPAFPIQQQQMRQWCWAACTSAISNFYQDGSPLTQAQLEAAMYTKPFCASGPLTESCDDTCDLATSLGYVSHLAEAFDNILPPDRVVQELAAGRPVCCQMNIPGIGGHGVVIVQAIQSGGRTSLQVADPGSGQINPMYYEDFRDNYLGGYGTWDKSYTTQ
jgi:hypothetical protein